MVLAALAAYAVLRLGLFHMLRQRSEVVIQSKAQENSTFIETVRAVQSLKLFNRESEREGQWLNRYAEVVNANVRLGRARITFQTLNSLVFGIENILTVYLAARLALDNVLTVGMVFAFMSYKRHFTEKTVMLVEKGSSSASSACTSSGYRISPSASPRPDTTSPWSIRGRSAAGSSSGTCPSATPRPSVSCWSTST